MEQQNRVFGNRYRIEERVGIGGMAEVYKATDEVLGRVVAIKVMLPQYAHDHTFAARFRQEAQAAANLSSPYIVSIYDWGQEGDTYYIAMEYVRGVDLKSAIQDRGAINPRKVAEIGSQVCAALSVAHAHDIIHRDIKPQNIMIQPDGNAKVMDFGIARAGNTNLTTTNSVLGTAHYVSPEQAQGKDLKPSSDLYSLGVTMYEAATGKLPFDGPDAVSVAMKQVSEQPIPPRQINPDIDPDLEAIILHAMEKDPEVRFTSATEMRNALRAYLAGAPLPAWGAAYGAGGDATRVMSGAEPTRKMADETTVMPSNGSYGPAQGTQVITPVKSKRQIRQADNATKPKRSKGPLIAAIVAIAALCALLGVLYATGTIGGGTGETAAVPNVVGMSQDEAEAAIKQNGFTVGTVTTRESSDVDAGRVISQDPTAGSNLSQGTKVNIVVSIGIGQVQVPDLSGMTASEADQAIKDAGLTPSNGGTETSDSVDANKVSSQSPAAGSMASKGATVTYMISSGADTVNVNADNYVGNSQSSVTTALRNLGLQVSVTNSPSDRYDEGTVISVSPTGEVKKNSTVTITVSSGSSSSSVPDVTGMSQSEAQSELSNAGFTYSVTTQSSSSVSAGTVISQSPRGGTKRDKGASVTITVSSGPSSSSGSGNGSGSGATSEDEDDTTGGNGDDESDATN